MQEVWSLGLGQKKVVKIPRGLGWVLEVWKQAIKLSQPLVLWGWRGRENSYQGKQRNEGAGSVGKM